jgi:hypothetical protein
LHQLSHCAPFMQSLAWSSVVILVLLLPGFFFYGGLYMPEQFARDVTPRNPLGALAATVLVAFVSHAVLTFAAPLVHLPVDWETVLDAIQLAQPRPGERVTSLHRVAAAYEGHAGAVVAYVISSCVFGWAIGLAVGWGVVSGRLRLMVKHSWTYGFKPGSRGQVPYAHVLTNVEHGGNVLQYRGRLLYFNLNADGTFAYVVLALTEQRFLIVDGQTLRAEAAAPRGSASPTAARRSDSGDRVERAGDDIAKVPWFHFFGRRKNDRARVIAEPAGLAEPDASEMHVASETPEPAAAFLHGGSGGAVLQGLQILRSTAARGVGGAIEVTKTGSVRGAKWFMSAFLRATKPDSTESLLVIPGAHVKSVVIDRVYQLQDLQAGADSSNEAAGVVEDPELTREEKLDRLTRLWQKTSPNRGLADVPAPTLSEMAERSPQELCATLQRMLRDLSYNPGPADGELGRSTRSALMQFQMDQALVADGVAGPATWKRLQKVHDDWKAT